MDENSKEKKEPKRKPVAVKVVALRGESALVEWTDGDDVRRVYVPFEKIENDKCPQDVLEAGIPYGAPWEELITFPDAIPQTIAKQLRRAGIWTSADIERHIPSAQRAINVATGLTPASLHGLARKYESKEA